MWLSAALACSFAFATAAPTPTNTAPPAATTSCHAKLFNEPWILRDITITRPSSGSKDGNISFHFCDPNDGLQMDTTCDGTIVNDACEGDDGAYVLCQEQHIGFKLSSDLIMLERAYIDDW